MGSIQIVPQPSTKTQSPRFLVGSPSRDSPPDGSESRTGFSKTILGHPEKESRPAHPAALPRHGPFSLGRFEINLINGLAGSVEE